MAITRTVETDVYCDICGEWIMENDCGLCDRTGRLVEDDDQRAFEDRFGSREEFMKIFGKNFIMEDHKHDGH